MTCRLRPPSLYPVLLSTVVLGFSHFGLAADGVLPRGKVQPTSVHIAPVPRTNITSCFEKLMRAPGANALFSADGRRLFFLRSLGKDIDGAKNLSTQLNFMLYEAPFPELVPRPIAGFKQLPETSLAVHGERIGGVSVLGFVERLPECRSGKALIVHLSFAKEQGGKAARTDGQYMFVESDHGPLLVDMLSGKFLEFDGRTFQSKAVNQIDPEKLKSSRPLFFNLENRQIFALANIPTKPTLTRSEGQTVLSSLPLRAHEKVLQDESLFAVAILNDKENKLTVLETEEWSGKGHKGVYELSVPADAPVLEAGGEITISAGYLALVGSGQKGAQRWGKVLIYDYRKKKLIKTLSASRGNYIAVTQFTHKGADLFFEERSIDAAVSTGFFVLHLETGKIKKIDAK